MLLFEYGLAQIYSNRYKLDAAKKCQKNKDDAIAGLTINNLMIAFVVLLVGFTVSLVVFIGERGKYGTQIFTILGFL